MLRLFEAERRIAMALSGTVSASGVNTSILMNARCQQFNRSR
jgi:hypothetical protein